MRKLISLAIVAFLMVVVLPLAASAHTCDDPDVKTLYAGQTIQVGTVKVCNDEEYLYVTYQTADGWVMTETHLYVGKTDPNELTNAPGQFPYSKDHDPAVNNYPYTISLSEIDSYSLFKGRKKWVADEDPGVGLDDSVYIAAQAVVQDRFQEETAWAEGTNFGISWAMYFTYTVQAAEAVASLEVGPEGGTLELGRFEVIVPSGLLPEQVEISVMQLPSQAEEVAQDLDPARAQAIGPAFQFEAPFFSNEPLTLSLSYDENDIPPGFEAQNLAILLRLEGYPESFGEQPPVELVMFVPLPAQVDEQEHKVEVDIFGGGTFQIVALAEALEVEVASLETKPQHFFKSALAKLIRPLNPFGIKEALANPFYPLDPFRVIFWEVPSDWTLQNRDEFKEIILYSLNEAYEKLVIGKGFPAPLAQVTVDVRKINSPDACAHVAPKNPLHIVVDPFKVFNPESPCLSRPLQSLVVHEYFHVIQHWNSNLTKLPKSIVKQVWLDNRWFSEGTAEWAMDEVFDGIPDHYIPPTGKRFKLQLNANAPPNFRDHYKTVAFWKWLEEKAPGSILAIIEHHRSLTHSSTSGPAPIKNSNPARYLDSLIQWHPNLNFLMFVTDALYWKDFDKDETGLGDLWDPNYLGPPKDIPKDLRISQRTILMRKGQPGDGSANKKPVEYKLNQHLSAEVYIIANGEGAEALSGTLHLEFEIPDDPALQIAIISRDNHLQKLVTDLSTIHEVTFGFGQGSEVIVIPVDPQLMPPSGGKGTGKFNVWVESCGGKPTGNVIYVKSNYGLRYWLYERRYAAGDIIRLAPGTYGSPDARYIIDRDVTIEGSGRDSTDLYFGRVSVQQDAHSVAFRDLHMRGGYISNISFIHFALCNVAWTGGGLSLSPPTGEDVDRRDLTFSVFDSVISPEDPAPQDGWAVVGYIYLHETVPWPSLTITIRDSLIGGFRQQAIYVCLNYMDPIDCECQPHSGAWKDCRTFDLFNTFNLDASCSNFVGVFSRGAVVEVRYQCYNTGQHLCCWGGLCFDRWGFTTAETVVCP